MASRFDWWGIPAAILWTIAAAVFLTVLGVSAVVIVPLKAWEWVLCRGRR